MRNSNRQWRLKRRPVGDVRAGDLELIETPKPVPGPRELLARNVYLSPDPTNRIRMSDVEHYMPPVNIGDVMRGGTQGVVEQSNAPDFAVGGIVLPGLGGWHDYTIAAAGAPIPADADGQIVGHIPNDGLRTRSRRLTNASAAETPASCSCASVRSPE